MNPKPITRRGALAHLGNLVLTATGAIPLAQLTGCDE